MVIGVLYFNNERNDFYLWDEEWARHVGGDALLLPEGVEKSPGFPYIAFDPNLIICEQSTVLGL